MVDYLVLLFFPEQSDSDVNEVSHDDDINEAEGNEYPQGRLVKECRQVHAHGFGQFSSAKIRKQGVKRCRIYNNGVESLLTRCGISHFFHIFLRYFRKKELSLQPGKSNIGMELTQFSAVVVLTLLVLKLLLLPRKVAVNPIVGRARWLMTVGIALLDVQFLLQYIYGLRAMGVTQAVLLNLILFIPCSWTISLALLYLQQRGNVSRMARWMGGATWAVVLVLLGTAAVSDGQPLLSGTSLLYKAEVAASMLYLIMQGYYSSVHLRNLATMRHTLQNFYDRDTEDMLYWMKLSIMVLMIMALMVPLLIFVESKGLAVFAFLFFIGIFFLVDSFCVYVVSSAPTKVSIAEENESEEDEERQAVNEETTNTNSTPEPATEVLKRVEEAAKRWVEEGGYRQSGINMPTAAEAIGTPRYLLSAWLRKQNLTYASWMNSLRINEAKRLLQEKSDWSNEAIAEYCGFSDRTYFQKKFKDATGMTPTDYIASLSRKSS